jgi:hypothetical protein
LLTYASIPVKLTLARWVHRLRFSNADRHGDDGPTAHRVGLIEAEQDRRLAPRFHIDAVRAVCAPREVVADMKTVGHGSRFSPWPASLAWSLTPLLMDPPGVDREEELPPVYRAIAAFLARDLMPGR